MDIKKLQTVVINALEDVKAQNIKVYDTTQLTSLFDRLCIASGTSNRQTKALASSVREKVKEHGGDVIGIEGEDTGEWVLVDLGDMIIHIMQPAIRDYYRLEELWGDREVPLKAAKAKRVTKTVSNETTPTPTKRVRKPAAKTSPPTSSPDSEKPKRTPRAIKVASDTTAKKKTVARKKTTDSTTSSAKPVTTKRRITKPKAV